MPSPLNHKQAFITPPHEGFRSNPLIGNFTSSPCISLPSTGEPCKLLNKPKDNGYCLNCFWIGQGDCKDPGEYVPKIVAPTDKRIHKCGFPMCENNTKGEYCRKHTNIINSRKAAHERDKPREPIDKDWLHRPIDMKKSRGGGRKFK